MISSIFDDDGNGTIDYRELIMGLETFRDTHFKEKLQGKQLHAFLGVELIYYISVFRFMRCGWVRNDYEEGAVRCIKAELYYRRRKGKA